ncbi:CAP domain-containing protein [Piscibacillus sp. B03]|uniref:CAP domain-containing protein n=1 Tax=Piscibacillus sp. B03 TaxID=3457430 RepID=UPI003FCE4093
MLRPITAVLITVIMSIILATGQVAASSQADSQGSSEAYTFTIPFSMWVQQDAEFNWNDFVNEYWNKAQEQQPVEQEQPQQPAEPKEEAPKQEQPEEPKEEAPKQEQPAEQEEPQQEQPVEQPQQEEQVEQPAQEQQEPQQASDLQAFEQQVVELVNQERQKHGLQPLEASSELSDVAREKSRDMAQNNYFSHTSPTYGSPFDMMQQFGIDYRTAGENIAMGQTSPEQVMNGWMNSDGHRKNILSSDFTHIGVGYVEANGKTYWTQMFIGK